MFHESSKVLAILIRPGPPKGRSVGKTKLLDEYSGYLLNGPRIECVVPEALLQHHCAQQRARCIDPPAVGCGKQTRLLARLVQDHRMLEGF